MHVCAMKVISKACFDYFLCVFSGEEKGYRGCLRHEGDIESEYAGQRLPCKFCPTQSFDGLCKFHKSECFHPWKRPEAKCCSTCVCHASDLVTKSTSKFSRVGSRHLAFSLGFVFLHPAALCRSLLLLGACDCRGVLRTGTRDRTISFSKRFRSGSIWQASST